MKIVITALHLSGPDGPGTYVVHVTSDEKLLSMPDIEDLELGKAIIIECPFSSASAKTIRELLPELGKLLDDFRPDVLVREYVLKRSLEDMMVTADDIRIREINEEEYAELLAFLGRYSLGRGG